MLYQTLVRLGSGDPSTSDIALIARFFGILMNRPCGESLVKSLKWPFNILILFSEFSSFSLLDPDAQDF